MNYKPDGHVFLKIQTTKETIYKVMGSWDGGYVTSDEWRINSGIKSITEDNGMLNIVGSSGSIYRVPKEGRGLNMYAQGILEQLGSSSFTIISIEELMEVFT